MAGLLTEKKFFRANDGQGNEPITSTFEHELAQAVLAYPSKLAMRAIRINIVGFPSSCPTRLNGTRRYRSSLILNLLEVEEFPTKFAKANCEPSGE